MLPFSCTKHSEIFFLRDIFVILEHFFYPWTFFFAIRYSAFKVPMGVDSDKSKPVYLLMLLYLTIRQKKSALKSHFKNFDFGSGGATLSARCGRDSLRYRFSLKFNFRVISA